MAGGCAAVPTIRVYLAGSDPVDIVLARGTLRYLIRAREAVDMTLALKADPRAFFTLDAGSTLSEERLELRNDLELVANVLSGSTIEVWSWEG